MTEAKALEILKKHDIHRDPYNQERLILNGEHVGTICFDLIYLSDYIPSVIGKIFKTVHATPVHLSKPDVVETLSRQIANLLNTRRRYDEDKRHERLNAMRKYFNSKRITAC